MSKQEQSKRSVQATKVINAYRRLFSSDDGQIVLKDMMSSMYISRSVIGATPYDTYFNEGVRSVLIRLLGTINMEDKTIERLIVEMNRVSDDEIML